MPGRVDMGAGVVGHGDEHRRQPVHAVFGQRIRMALPDAVDDGGMPGIARGAMIKLAAEIDDFHFWFSLGALPVDEHRNPDKTNRRPCESRDPYAVLSILRMF